MLAKNLLRIRNDEIVAKEAIILRVKGGIVHGKEARQKEHAKGETPVSNSVDDECLVGGFCVRDFFVPKADQQVGAKANAFPPNERENKVVA